jgi:hypothetical protein
VAVREAADPAPRGELEHRAVTLTIPAVMVKAIITV